MLLSQFPVVINLTIENDGKMPEAHGLFAAGNIKDSQAVVVQLAGPGSKR